MCRRAEEGAGTCAGSKREDEIKGLSGSGRGGLKVELGLRRKDSGLEGKSVAMAEGEMSPGNRHRVKKRYA